MTDQPVQPPVPTGRAVEPAGSPGPVEPPAATAATMPSAYGAPASPYGSPATAYGAATPAGSPYGSSYGSVPPAVAPAPATEDVARGLLFALAAIPVGVVLSVVIWQAGFVASISAFVLAALAAWLYRKGAGAVGGVGFVVVAVVVVVGLVASMAGIVAFDLSRVYTEHASEIGVSQSTFVTSNLFDGGVWGEYGSDFAMFALFGLLGAAGTLMRLRRATR